MSRSLLALQAPHGERLKADLTLLSAALMWGGAFVAHRLASPHLNVFLYNGARFLLAAATLALLVGPRLREITRLELGGGLLAGSVLFCAAGFQQAGIHFTTAGKAAFITGLYVVLVPLFLAVGRRKWPHWLSWAASLLAATGLLLLSGVERLMLAPGDALELAGAVFWALHVILIGWLAQQVDVLRLVVIQDLTCGLLNLPLGLSLTADPLMGLQAAWLPVVYSGVFSAGIGFTLQALGQRKAPAADAAVILSMEAVFAGLFGWLILGEMFTPRQLLGCGLIFTGMIVTQVRTLGSNRGNASPSV